MTRRPKACPYRRTDGTYWARIRYTDESGKVRDEVARAESAADANAKSIELVKQYEAEHGLSMESPTPITFNKFSELFTPHIERQRSYQTTLGFLHTLRGHFGNKRLASITYSDVQEYAKNRRKAVSLRTGKKLKRASVNREIALLSSMFKEAIGQGFAVKNPVKDGPPLIKVQDEIKRDRVLSEEEEGRLLAACAGRRAHLRLIIRAALDTGATKSQLLRLTWGDLHIGLREVTIHSSDNKAPRKAKMRDTLANELAKLHDELLREYSNDPDLRRDENAPLFHEWLNPKRVFRDFKSSFSSACRAAKIKDLRFNDLRRTHRVRLQAFMGRWMALTQTAAKKRKSEETS
jgi:integrase